ncbi:lipopolysaccharide kinase InaA family protein [Thauera sp.]|uniref:lipopolysaccharide kinase InaA family protein n=1 Tax=Thauera sp. TaxID=1905334 RepID=UPI0039E3D9C6
MTTPTAQTASSLRAAGREPPLPFAVTLDDGRELVMLRVLRILPSKRIVGEAETAGSRMLAKLFIAPGSTRHWQRERQGIEALAAAGIPTPALRHAGELHGGGHVLLTDFLADAASLSDHWQAVAGLPASHADALAVLAPAFAMLGRMHAHGLVQDDLHLGNFLVSGGELMVIDGDAVRSLSPGQALQADQAAANFAILAAQLPAGWDEHIAPLIDAWRQDGEGLPTLDTAALRERITHTRDARLKDFLAKTLRDCTLFKAEKTFDRLTIAVRAEADELAEVLADPDAAIAHGSLLKDGGTCTVAKLEHGNRPLVIKRYNLKNTRHALSRAWRPSRAAHSWVEGHRLAFLGIATPAPLAMIEERAGPLRRRAWIINAWCPGEDLATHLAPYVDSGPPPAEAEALRTLFATLYRERISHGDMKATNLLWHDGHVVLIDLDAMQQHRSASSHARAWRRDRARLLRNWPTDSALWRWLDANLPPA